MWCDVMWCNVCNVYFYRCICSWKHNFRILKIGRSAVQKTAETSSRHTNGQLDADMAGDPDFACFFPWTCSRNGIFHPCVITERWKVPARTHGRFCFASKIRPQQCQRQIWFTSCGSGNSGLSFAGFRSLLGTRSRMSPVTPNFRASCDLAMRDSDAETLAIQLEGWFWICLLSQP